MLCAHQKEGDWARCDNCGGRGFSSDFEREELVCNQCGKVAPLELTSTFRKSEGLGSVSDQHFPANSDYLVALRRIERTTFDNSKEVVRRQIDELSHKAGIPEGVRIAVTEYAEANTLGGRVLGSALRSRPCSTSSQRMTGE